MDLEGIFSYRLGSRQYFMISPTGLKRKEKESPFATVLRGIPGGVQEVVTATDAACSLGTQEAAARPLVGGDSRALTCLVPVRRLPPPELQLCCSSPWKTLHPGQGLLTLPGLVQPSPSQWSHDPVLQALGSCPPWSLPELSVTFLALACEL